MDNKKGDGKVAKYWKILAIVFILLFTLETIAIVEIAKMGIDSIGAQNECQIKICGDAKYNSYYYDTQTKACYCYTNSQITHQEILK
jgi:hypothetical protein